MRTAPIRPVSPRCESRQSTSTLDEMTGKRCANEPMSGWPLTSSPASSSTTFGARPRISEHKDVRVRGEMALLEARGSDAPPPPVGQLAARYAGSSLRFERETSTLRSLDPWQFQLSGGVIPLSPVDWYAMAQITFNVGSFERNHHEQQYVNARKDELDHARHEISTRVHEYREQLRATLDQARRELEVVERESDFLTSTRTALEKSEAQGVAHVRDTMNIEHLVGIGFASFFTLWISALASSLEDSHG